MTVISDRIEDVAGRPPFTNVTFWVEAIRETVDGDAIVVPVRHEFQLDDGNLLTTELDPGPAVVRLYGAGVEGKYHILIPDSDVPVRLWPLIDANLPAPPADPDEFIRSDGVLRRAKFMLKTDFDDLTMLDPSTIYYISDI